ncbi:MAG: hypothetical protein WA949_21460, partial [Phormidesmis sp.]
MKLNPFSYGNAVVTQNFLNRKKPLSRVARRLASGQSSAIIGEPRIGKTSFLRYIAAVENRIELYKEAGERIVFSEQDSHMFPQKFTPAQFWERALLPLKEQIIDVEPGTLLYQQYQTCKENQFGTFTLETFFQTLKQAHLSLVLLI